MAPPAGAGEALTTTIPIAGRDEWLAALDAAERDAFATDLASESYTVDADQGGSVRRVRLALAGAITECRRRAVKVD